MPNLVFLDVLLKQTDSPLMTDHIPIHGTIVADEERRSQGLVLIGFVVVRYNVFDGTNTTAE